MIWRGSLITVVFCLLLPGYYAQDYYEFTTHPSNVYLAGSVSQVVMSCRAAPVTGLTWTYQWRLNNDYLSAQRGNARFTGFNSNELTIGSATSDIYDTTLFGNSNNFTCVATNSKGRMTSRIANILRVAGQATSIKCGDTKFPEIPTTMLWHYTKNELRLNPSSDGRIAIALDGTLYFANLLVSDATRYRCGVRPTQPDTSTNIFFSGNTTLTIQPRDFGPEFHKRSGNVQAVIGSSITLECIPKG
ncbi:Contactin-1a, partial [Trichoplax sp. H2]